MCFFEGFVLGIIGIPAGIFAWRRCNCAACGNFERIARKYAERNLICLCCSMVAAVISAVMSAVIILFSTLSSAFRASRIAPITAIRGNNDIKINKKKSYKSPKFIKKLFGVGGEIA